MRTMNIRPAFRYRFQSSMRSAVGFFGIMVLITAALAASFIRTTVSFGGEAVSGSVSAYGFASCITVFVLGICSVREDLRLAIQHGVSRRTVFVSELLSTLAVCLFLAAAGELLLATAQAVTAGYENLHITDMYYGIYADWQLQEYSIGQHIEAMFFNLSLLLFANIAGMLLSLMFYRLNKAWTVIVAVGAPVIFFIGLPILMNAAGPAPKMSRLLTGFVDWVLSSPWVWIFVFILAAVVIAIINWLLIRRAPVIAAKG